MTAVAFDAKYKFPVQPMFSSDIMHWDVPDPSEVLEEAWELVADGLITRENFKAFTFSNAVRLHGGMNPERALALVDEIVAQESAAAPARQPAMEEAHA